MTQHIAENAVPEWPGMPTDQPHGTAWHKDYTGDPVRWCQSCGGVHHPRYNGCNGLREQVTERCPMVLGEVQCHRPADHLGEHLADSAVLRMAWTVKAS